MGLTSFDHCIVRVTDRDGRVFTGRAEVFPSGYGLCEFDREEEGLQVGEYVFFIGDIARLEALPEYAVHRAARPWRREPGAQELADVKYIIITDGGFLAAAARMHPLDRGRMMIDRVAVRHGYLGQGLRAMALYECEAWAEELLFAWAVLESPGDRTAYYQELGYDPCGAQEGAAGRVRMEKPL